MTETTNDDPTSGKPERWLRPNVRLLALGLILPGLLSFVGILLVMLARSPWLWIGVGLLVLGLFVTVAIYAQMRLPRMGYRDGELLLYLRTVEPARVPIEVVECFFLGQAPSMVKARAVGEIKTAAVVVRLAEAAKEWHQRDVKPELGQWRDGYITIRGTWCEPLTPELLKHLNHRLSEIHRQRRQANSLTT